MMLLAAVPGIDAGFLVDLALFMLFLVVSAIFSGTEVALLSLGQFRRRQMVKDKVPGSEHVERLLRQPRRFLITILVANNLANIAAAALATRVALDLVGESGVAIATGVTTFLVLTFSEIGPKAYAAQHNEQVSLWMARPILYLQWALTPVVVAYDAFTKWLLRLFGATPEGVASSRTFTSEQEFRTLISVGAEEGLLEDVEEELIHSVMEFADILVSEVMVPRNDVLAVEADAPLDAVRQRVVDSGYTRIPVFDGSRDNIIGILFVKDLLVQLIGRQRELKVRDLMREGYYVPETKRVVSLLREMRENRVHMVVVIDEFGGTAGIATLEDVLEEIVGEIYDEYDLRLEKVRELDAQTAVVDARVHVDDLNEKLGLDIPEEGPYDTVAGYIVHQLGRVGREGETVRHHEVDLIIDKATPRRILRVRVVRPAVAGDGDAADE